MLIRVLLHLTPLGSNNTCVVSDAHCTISATSLLPVRVLLYLCRFYLRLEIVERTSTTKRIGRRACDDQTPMTPCASVRMHAWIATPVAARVCMPAEGACQRRLMRTSPYTCSRNEPRVAFRVSVFKPAFSIASVCGRAMIVG